MVADNPKLKEDPPLLESTERSGTNGDAENGSSSTDSPTDSPEAIEVLDASEPAESEAALAAPEVRAVKVHQQVSALAILCMLTALLSPLFFPALAAIPLGVFALRRINESDGMLSGRHLAITGLCIATTALAFWMAFFAFIWLVGSLFG